MGDVIDEYMRHLANHSHGHVDQAAKTQQANSKSKPLERWDAFVLCLSLYVIILTYTILYDGPSRPSPR